MKLCLHVIKQDIILLATLQYSKRPNASTLADSGFFKNLRTLTERLWQYHPKWKQPKWIFLTFCGLAGGPLATGLTSQVPLT